MIDSPSDEWRGLNEDLEAGLEEKACEEITRLRAALRMVHSDLSKIGRGGVDAHDMMRWKMEIERVLGGEGEG